uniref:NADH-ubiquinone oxidoreductase chain 1 n=1 Tax=Jenufa minuta TaxID=993092 RepID=A0A6G7ITQ2_JENMI|nr:NADH dehydrogenase subunit 1 [Jenufa minuta]QII41633.1 NADH dehydrogenase subunit 1 [Jenufa minuta]
MFKTMPSFVQRKLGNTHSFNTMSFNTQWQYNIPFESYIYDHIWTQIIQILCTLVPLLLAVAFLTYAERKIMASMQRRIGPSVWGLFGVLQAFIDGLKLFVKEPSVPSTADQPLYIWAPMLTFIVSQIAWAAIPFGETNVISDLTYGAFYLLAVSSVGVYGILLAGWASNSKYAFLGCCRSVAQMISYELPMGMIILTVSICAGSLNIAHIVSSQYGVWFALALWPQLFIWFICTLAETNRSPFDLPEAEAELVAGYNVEYGAMGFALFFIAEYANMIFMSTQSALFFFGGDSSPITLLPNGCFWLWFKTFIFLFLFVWVRATLPRYRFDMLMRLGWKVFLPYTIAGFLTCAACLYAIY